VTTSLQSRPLSDGSDPLDFDASWDSSPIPEPVSLQARPAAKRSPARSAFGRSVGRSIGKWTALATVFAVLAFVAVPRLWRGFNPMASKKVDRTQPALLSAISNLSDYRAASAQFTVVVDIEDDAKWLPAAVRGERTVLLASGSVDAGVDLSGLGASSITIDEVTKSVVLRLPHAKLRKAELDLGNTTVVQHKRGILDRVGSAFGDAPKGENRALKLAQTKLENAAKASTVLAVAETNTTTMMTSLVRGLGYNTVRIEFV
jgi:Protein of unknown function (DUF4230)